MKTARIDGGEPEGYAKHPNDLDCRASTVILCKAVGDALEKHYPGWLWAVQPDERGGVLRIYSLRLSGEWAYTFKLVDIQGDPKPAMLKVMRGAGEILERFGVRRGTYRYEDWRKIPRDFRDLPMPDISDKPLKAQRKERDLILTEAVRSGRAEIQYRDTRTATGTYRELVIKGT